MSKKVTTTLCSSLEKSCLRPKNGVHCCYNENDFFFLLRLEVDVELLRINKILTKKLPSCCMLFRKKPGGRACSSWVASACIRCPAAFGDGAQGEGLAGPFRNPHDHEEHDTHY